MGHHKTYWYTPNECYREIEGAERIFEEIMAENSPNLMENNNLHVHEAQHIPSRINTKKSTHRHTAVKVSKAEGKENFESSNRKDLSNPRDLY